MLGRDYRGQNCSVARALEVVGERWTLLILRDCFLGVTRFERFAERLGIATNVLARRLDTLTDAGVLERRPYREGPVRHEYVLTPAGHDLFPVILALLGWGDAHAAPDGPPVLVTHRGCDGPVGAGAVCGRCGAPVTSADADWRWGPGSGREVGTLRPPG